MRDFLRLGKKLKVSLLSNGHKKKERNVKITRKRKLLTWLALLILGALHQTGKVGKVHQLDQVSLH